MVERGTRVRTRLLEHLPLLVALVVATVVRVGYLLRDNTLSADEAVTGIMARRMANGSHFYLFFAGQNYNSAVEQYPQALLFWLGAPQNAFTLRLPQLVLNLLSCWVIYLIGRRIFQDRWRPGLAALLFALGPVFQIARGSTTTGSYTAQLLLGVLTVLAAVALSDRLGRRNQVVLALVLGFALTGTYYLTASGYYLVLPALIWALPALIRLRLLPFAAITAVFGALPNTVWALWHGASILPAVGIQKSTAGGRLKLLLDSVGREFLGLAHSFGSPGMPVFWARLILWVALAGLVVAIVLRRRSILATLLLRRTGRQPLDIVMVGAIITIVVFVGSKYSWSALDPRYLYAANPILVLLLASLASPTAFHRFARRVLRSAELEPADGRPLTTEALPPSPSADDPAVGAPRSGVVTISDPGSLVTGVGSRVAAAVVGVALILLIGIPTAVMLSYPSTESNGNPRTGPTRSTDPDMERAIGALEKDGTKYIYSSYWQAVQVDFLARGSLTCVSYGSANRFPDDRQIVDATPAQQVAWLEITTKSPRGMRATLNRNHISYRAQVFGVVTVYDQLSKPVRPRQIGMTGP